MIHPGWARAGKRLAIAGPAPIGDVVFSPDGRFVASLWGDRRARVRDAATGREQGSAPSREGPRRSLGLASDGKTLFRGRPASPRSTPLNESSDEWHSADLMTALVGPATASGKSGSIRSDDSEFFQHSGRHREKMDQGLAKSEPIGRNWRLEIVYRLAYSTLMSTMTDKIGIGIYSPAEAAFYARISPKIMTRWVFGDSEGKPVIDRQLPDPSEKVVTFLDFVQTLAVREVRNRHGISLQKIRNAVDKARDEYGIRYPLACWHAIYLFGDQKGQGHGEIVIRLAGEGIGDEDRHVQLTGPGRDSLLMYPVVETFLQDLRFDPETKLASQYSPLSKGNASIVLNPHRRFGEPIVDPGGYTAEALWHATNTEGGINEAAEAYGVTVAEVELANRYFDGLLLDRAA